MFFDVSLSLSIHRNSFSKWQRKFHHHHFTCIIFWRQGRAKTLTISITGFSLCLSHFQLRYLHEFVFNETKGFLLFKKKTKFSPVYSVHPWYGKFEFSFYPWPQSWQFIIINVRSEKKTVHSSLSSPNNKGFSIDPLFSRLPKNNNRTRNSNRLHQKTIEMSLHFSPD